MANIVNSKITGKLVLVFGENRGAIAYYLIIRRMRYPLRYKYHEKKYGAPTYRLEPTSGR